MNRAMSLRVGDETLLCGVKLDSRRVARGTHAGSVVVEELVPFSGVMVGKGKEESGTRDLIRTAVNLASKAPQRFSGHKD